MDLGAAMNWLLGAVPEHQKPGWRPTDTEDRRDRLAPFTRAVPPQSARLDQLFVDPVYDMQDPGLPALARSVQGWDVNPQMRPRDRVSPGAPDAWMGDLALQQAAANALDPKGNPQLAQWLRLFATGLER